ncbi:MAG: DUF4340 domain-containing protein [Acidobacteriota bacterium]
MGLRNTLVALLVLAGLVGFIYYYEYRGEPAREAAREAETKPWIFERDQIAAIAIAPSQGEHLRLRRQDDTWRITSPIETLADSGKVDNLLNKARFLRINRTIEHVTPAERKAYKLDPPAARMTLQRSENPDGADDLTLAIGDKAPVGEGYYALKPGEDDVILLSGGIEEILAAGAKSLRLKKLVGVDSWKITSFKVEAGDRSLEVKKTGDLWKLARPVPFPADAGRVQQVLDSLASAEAVDFASEDPSAEDLRRFGLTPEPLVIEVLASDANIPVRATLGASDQAGHVYARRGDMRAILKIDAKVSETLHDALARPQTLRDARVAPINRFGLTRIAMRSPGGETLLLKDDGSKWHWGGEKGSVVDSEKINAFLDAIEALKAESFVDEGSPAEPSAAPFSVTLSEGEDEAVRRVITMRFLRKDGERAYMASSAAASLYVLPAEKVDALIKSADEIHEPPASPDPSESKGDNQGG